MSEDTVKCDKCGYTSDSPPGSDCPQSGWGDGGDWYCDGTMRTIQHSFTRRSQAACTWCGKSYEEHRDDEYGGPTLRVPCGGVKAGFHPPIESDINRDEYDRSTGETIDGILKGDRPLMSSEYDNEIKD